MGVRLEAGSQQGEKQGLVPQRHLGHHVIEWDAY
jgi:hypothetical protein